MRQITEESTRAVQNKLKEEKGIDISYEESEELSKHFEKYMKVLPERLKRAKRRRNIKILILLAVVGLAVAYVLHFQWKLELAEAKANIYLGMVERRSDKILDLENDILLYEEAIALRCSFPVGSTVLKVY